MRISLDKRSGLRALRIARRFRGIPAKREPLVPQNPGEGRLRWSSELLSSLEFGGYPLMQDGRLLDVAVPNRDNRLQSSLVSNTVCGRSIPKASFVPLGDGLQLACSELIFLEMAEIMDDFTHALLGYELCSTYARDPDNPRSGDVRFMLPVETTPQRIRSYIEATGKFRGKRRALENLSFVSANAWSPMEALLALLIQLPPQSLGYGLGPVVLNKRVDVGEGATRVPDILFEGTMLGINYDGGGHFDLDSLARAAAESATHPENVEPEKALEDAKRRLRSSYADDRARDRELVSAGYTVITITAEDMKDQTRLDRIMIQLMDALEANYGFELSTQRRFAHDRRLRKDRQNLCRSAMPGKVGTTAQRKMMEARQRMLDRMRETTIELL